ncbi:gluconate 2-dehydrogenase subunit 3 family protein [Muriicola sp. Z0-33]|uniref:gluconate 2-dehydrogenase subunit 3 family protein n=1 Tax=Muriicola sp. Z0-33 TaxID=2816957 RepID=UPI002238E4B4|nr:gluconate 2-dehydrogenase subunit 3 family protein [Muriicola sp. Z0-33]MCW5515643.1 gluconate 2-dehydrogenase subunit 3 family protein [Muriicola sp. Z0-33]
MDRRNSIKSIILGSVAGGLAVHGCKPGPEVTEGAAAAGADEHYFGRTPEELELIAELEAEQFFNEHEMETITVLCNLILPPDDKGGIVEAGVPEFIEFIAKDMPHLQTTFRGGLMWLDHKSNTDFGTEFKVTPEDQQKQILDTIAFYDPETPMSEQPLEIQFFALMRNHTVSGYYTSKIGIEDLGYKGNMPNVWDGVPQDVLDQHGLAYDEDWIAKCVDQSKRGIIAEWDDEGNLLT